MTTNAYVVVRVVPESPIDGATFSTYLNGLTLQALDANTNQPISDQAYASPLTAYVFGQIGTADFWSAVSLTTSASTPYDSSKQNYGSTLQFESTDGISVGSYAYSADQTTIKIGGVQVNEVTANTVTLSTPLQTYVPAGTVVTFLSQPQQGKGSVSTTAGFSFPLAVQPNATGTNTPSAVLTFNTTDGVMVGMGVSDGQSIPSGTIVTGVTPTTVTISNAVTGVTGNVTFTLEPPFLSITGTPTSGGPPTDPTTLHFTSGDNNAIPVGAVLTPILGLVEPGTTVTGATQTTVTLSQKLQKSWPANTSVTFNFALSQSIAQHTETSGNFTIPAAVATAVLQLTEQPPDYLDIKILATRDTEVIPLTTTYYNVNVSTDAIVSLDGIPDSELYPLIPASATSLYLALPPTPGPNTVALATPSDGSAPPFGQLYQAIQTALKNDPIQDTSGQQVTPADLTNSSTWCTRIAYDIVWSYQNELPPLPDPLESLYTNPPNPGGGGDSSGNSNNYEQDRQKFEGTLNSFYSTRNANAERLTKFVAAASAAVACEQYSLNATSALLEFPVDPDSSVPLSAAIDTEITLEGINGTSGLNFGVPAAFFYTLGATLDKTTTAAQRYQLATGDAIERLLQQFAAAVDTSVITENTEGQVAFSNSDPGITSFQAARRLVALGVPTASTTPSVTVKAGSPLVQLANGWLNATDPNPTLQPPPSYQTDDYTIWLQLAASSPTAQQGYLDLDLAALTQGYLINSNATLADEIAAALPAQTIAALKSFTAVQWTTFFTQNPSWLPPFTQPVSPGPSASGSVTQAGYLATRIRAFVRTVEQFFTVSTATTSPAALPPAGEPPTFDLPTYDPISQAATDLGLTFGGTALTQTELAGEAHTIFDGDWRAQGWLVEAMTTINELWQIAIAVPNPTTTPYTLPYPVSLQFSIMEALYARGVLRAAEITALSQTDFQQALTGTVAYDHSAALYTAAQKLAQATPTNGQADTGFEPVNPDGSLVDCVPPPCLSPTGPIAYLQEMLTLSALSNCEDAARESVTLTTTGSENGSGVLPFGNGTNGVSVGMSVGLSSGTGGQIPTGTTVVAVADTSVTVNPTVQVGSGEPVMFTAPTLGSVLSQRRGPVGQLAASSANLQTTLPLIDLVNECLEYLGSAGAVAAGAVYDTAADVLAGHTLAQPEPGQSGSTPEGCHDPARLLAALPQHSTPGLPDDSTPQPPVYQQLKADFSSCLLPYSQALDVSRTYLAELGNSRFEEMRTFRRCITEFVFDPTQEPAGFQSWRRRYPVRIDTAIEYLHITPEEYTTLFSGAAAPPCAVVSAPQPVASAPQPVASEPQPPTAGAQAPDAAAQASEGTTTQKPATQVAVQPSATQSTAPQAQEATASRGPIGLPAVLAETCLTYCEFYELWESGYVPFNHGAANPADAAAREGNGSQDSGAFPCCEPCCCDELQLQFPDGQEGQGLAQLQLFARLWRKLRESCRGGYSFAQLRDICDVLQMWNGTQPNSDFIRQLAAFEMLRDDFGMELTNTAAPAAPGAVDADRTHLLALWVGASTAQWPWALRQLITRVEQHALRRHDCPHRPVEFVKLLIDNLDPLSRLAGFDPDSAQNCWHALPTHTLRFAEVLAKIYASDFTVGELLFLFTAEPHLDGDDPFPLQAVNDALDFPLGLPDDQLEQSLGRLRRVLLEAHTAEAEDDEVVEGDGEQWPWPRIETALHTEFGFAPTDVAELGQHFFPRLVARLGAQPTTTPSTAWFVSTLDANDTSAPMWNDPPDGPLHYDPTPSPGQPGQLSTRVPLSDRAVIAKLTAVRELQDPERKAVQDLFFQPRALLGRFALLFADFPAAQRALIEEPDEQRRFAYFRRQFLRCRRRAHLIADHLACHVAAVTGHQAPDDAAALVLRALAADENMAQGSWENDSGAPPQLTWAQPTGSALAALLGLTGTGLTVEYRSAGGAVVWRDLSGGLRGFGDERNRENCPVPTVLPGMDATLPPQQLQFAGVHNGLLMNDATGAWLGGAQGFTAIWSGALLIDRAGTYEFWAGAPTPSEDRPEPCGDGECHRWRIVLRRGQRTWVILSHHWDGEEERPAAALPLKLGAYELTAELIQPEPQLSDGDGMPVQHTGFQVKYRGPDTDCRRVEIPHSALFAVRKDQTLADEVMLENLGSGATNYLSGLYYSSLRDIRRTYQRAFKALLLSHRLELSARRQPHGTSELGYLLAQGQLFAGAGYYQSGGTFTLHAANLDFDFLPLRDDYRPPTSATDERTAPSPQRIQAMFDWWERLFDYGIARAQVRSRSGHQLWQLFEEAQEKQPAHPGYLLRHMGADARHWQLDLRYFQGQNTPVYEVGSADLCDDTWTLRAWHADRWLQALQDRFGARDIEAARPDLWAADDPAAQLPNETQVGNANLMAFVADGCLENDALMRYEDLQRINDGLRERGRRALIAYLCHNNRVQLSSGQFATTPSDLSDLLLLDVQAGLHEKASRIEEAITAAQTFIRRSRLGLEPGWKISREFAQLWDSRFDTYQIWQRARARELYRENWIEFEELSQARRIEAFQFLESQLRTSTLSLAAPGGLDWWLDDNAGLEHAPQLLQRRVPSNLHMLSTEREGLTTIGYPQYAAQPTWLAALPQPGTSETNGSMSSSTTPGAGSSPAAPPDPVPAPADDNAVPAASAGPAPASNAPPSPAPPVETEGSVPLPLWMKAAMKLGTRFVRVAAAGPPLAALEFVPHTDKPRGACCRECGHEHPAGVDEYYFWLVNSQVYSEDVDASDTGNASFTASYQFGFQDPYYDQVQQQSIEWDDENQVPPLLAKWQPTPAVRLAWCRMHNGQFGQPRQSTGYVLVDEQTDLTLLGRAADSLYFAVTGALPPPAGYGASADGATSGDSSADMSPPGFRYDLPTDDAVALPLALQPPAPTPPPPLTQYPGGLVAYPFFAYEEPGARLFPGSWFATSMAVAGALRARCGYELALRWYRRAFDPLQNDCAWMHCPGTGTSTPTATNTNIGQPSQEAANNATATNGHQPTRPGACCDATQVGEQGARHRAVTMNYCQTLIEWGDALMRGGHSPEAFQQARVLYSTAARITGPRPQTILLPESSSAATVTDFVPAYPSLNPQLIDLYDLIADRVGLIHRSLDARRLRNGRPDRDMPYFGNRPAADLPGAEPDPCGDHEDWCGPPSPYRFQAQVQKAIELAGKVRELGATLLSAYEKGDAEYLAAMRAEQEREMQALGIAIRQDQWRDADWQVQALQQTKDLDQANLLYYFNLYQGGLINDEIQDLSLTSNALQTRTSANMVDVEGEVMSIIPDFFVGAMSTFSQVPIGTKLAGLFHAIAQVMRTEADIQSTNAGLDATEASWQRRSVEWLHQMQTLPIQIQQAELQILGAHRRRDQALAELNNQQRQIEHSTEVLDFLRDKFSATDLYLWLQSQTAQLYSQMYELALRAAREAERSFYFELRPTHRRQFLPEDTWDSLHAGLMAGEHLDAAVHRMEKAYLDENRRELELTKHISLRLDMPAAYLRLRTTGYCEISIPEWIFDLDYPGHYLRRIKNVTLTLPCVTGPYTGVHCRLTLLSSMTRTHPEVRPPAQHCCCDGQQRSDYEPCLEDPRVVRDYAARESIATSSGQNDSGLFELSFRDERYLPFEYLGTVSRWRIEMPPENNYFDLNTLTDVVLNLNYTAREGGRALRDAAADAARGRLPGNGLRLFDVRHDFPDAWPALRDPGHRDERADHRRRQRRLRLGFTQAMFPFLPGRRVHSIDRMLLIFAAPDAAPGRHHLVRFCRDGDTHAEAHDIECVASDAWPGLFCGTIDLPEHPLQPLREDAPTVCTFEIPTQAGEICNAFLVAHYDATPLPRCGPPPPEPGIGDAEPDGADTGSDPLLNGQRSAAPVRG